jgi:hypothetical protein
MTCAAAGPTSIKTKPILPNKVPNRLLFIFLLRNLFFQASTSDRRTKNPSTPFLFLAHLKHLTSSLPGLIPFIARHQQ